MKKTKMTAVAATARRSGRQIQAGLDVVASDGGNRLNKKRRSALNDGNGKQKEMRPAVSDRRVTRFASKQQELEKDDNRRIKDYGLDVVASDGGNRLNKKRRSALNDGNGKRKEMRPAVSDRRVTRFASKQQELEKDDNRRIKDYGLDVVASDGGNRFNKKKRSALNDGNGKRKEMRPAVLDHRVSRFACKQQELEKDYNRRIVDYGFDVGDIPLTEDPQGFVSELQFKSHWTEVPLGRAPMEYEELAKIGLKTFNLQNGTSYEFTKIVRVNSLLKGMYETNQIIFLAGGDSFLAKAGSMGDYTVVPFCKKVLDVAAEAEQTKTFSDLTRSAIEEQLEERQKLMMEENQRIKMGHGPDFEGDAVVNTYGKFYPCWSESSGSPAPQIYEEMSRIGLRSYNSEFSGWFQFVELLRVYFHEEGNAIMHCIYFRAGDSYAASLKVFRVVARSDDKWSIVVGCSQVEPEWRDIRKVALQWGWYWRAAEYREF